MKYLLVLLFALAINNSTAQSALGKLVFFYFDSSKSKSAGDVDELTAKIYDKIVDLQRKNDILKGASIALSDDGSTVRNYKSPSQIITYCKKKNYYNDIGTFIVFFQIEDVPNRPSNSERELVVEMVNVSTTVPALKILADQIVGPDDISRVVENIVQFQVIAAFKGIWKDSLYFYDEGNDKGKTSACNACRCYVNGVQEIFFNQKILSKYYLIRKGVDRAPYKGIVFKEYKPNREQALFGFMQGGAWTDYSFTTKGCSNYTFDKNMLDQFSLNIMKDPKKD